MLVKKEEAKKTILNNVPGTGTQNELNEKTLTLLQKRAMEIADRYRDLPLQSKIDIIAHAFGCRTGTIRTSPCRGKWRGTSDMFICFDNDAKLFIGNRLTPKAKTVKVQKEYVDRTLVAYNPEIVQITKEVALSVLLQREVKDNKVALAKGLKPYTLLNVEFRDAISLGNSPYMGWYYVTLAVNGKIRAHLESGLQYEIADGKVSSTLTRDNYYVAGALKESDVDYVFDNVGFSSKSSLYTLPLQEAVLERAKKRLAERTIQHERDFTPDARETGETVRTSRGTFHVTDMSREQIEAVGYGFHHQSEDGNGPVSILWTKKVERLC